MYTNTISTAHDSDQETELELLKKEIREVHIVVANPTSNRNYVKNIGKTPMYSLLFPNNFFLWQKHRILESKLRQRPSDFINLANESVPDTMKLQTAPTLEKRLQNESMRFQAILKSSRVGRK